MLPNILPANQMNAFISGIRGIRTITSGATVTMVNLDGTVLIDKTAGSATAVSLPPSPTINVAYTVADGKGDAPTHNITVTDPNSYNIDGNASDVLNVAFASKTYLWTGPTIGWKGIA